MRFNGINTDLRPTPTGKLQRSSLLVAMRGGHGLPEAESRNIVIGVKLELKAKVKTREDYKCI